MNVRNDITKKKDLWSMMKVILCFHEVHVTTVTSLFFFFVVTLQTQNQLLNQLSGNAVPPLKSCNIANSGQAKEIFQKKNSVKFGAFITAFLNNYLGLQKIISSAKIRLAITEPLQSKNKVANRAAELIQKLRVCFRSQELGSAVKFFSSQYFGSKYLA